MRQHLSFILSEQFISAALELRNALRAVISNRSGQNPYLHPHITAAEYGLQSSAELLSTVEQFCACHDPVPFTVDAIGIFVGESLFAAPMPSAALLNMHGELHSLINAPVPAWLAPDNWMPHIALIFPFNSIDAQDVMGCLEERFVKMNGEVIGIHIDVTDNEAPSTNSTHRFFFRGVDAR